jgi:hypothetical protein
MGKDGLCLQLAFPFITFAKLFGVKVWTQPSAQRALTILKQTLLQ